MSEHRDTWPEILRRFAELIGDTATMAIARHSGGVERFHIPKHARPGHPWAELIGLEEFEKLCRAFGGEKLDIPRGHFIRLRKREIIELHERGLSHRQIALRTESTQRYVRSVLSGGGAPAVDPRQAKLPF